MRNPHVARKPSPASQEPRCWDYDYVLARGKASFGFIFQGLITNIIAPGSWCNYGFFDLGFLGSEVGSVYRVYPLGQRLQRAFCGKVAVLRVSIRIQEP